MRVLASAPPVRATIAASAALAGALAVPAVASAALPAADAGEYCIQGLTNDAAKTAVGLACYFPSSGKLTVSDNARDGHGAHAQLVYGTRRATVGDPDGSKSRRGEKIVKVPRRTVPHLRLCVTGLGCTRYKIPRDV